MSRKIITVFIASFLTMAAFSQELSLKRGLVIKKTTKVKKANYVIDAFDSLNRSAIIIEGNNIVVDFNKSTLTGSKGKTRPDLFFGTAIIIRKGKNITIKNLTVKGYKVVVSAEGVEELKIENCDFSYNYRGSLNDLDEKLLPGKSFNYSNENDRWLIFGAAMYFKNCNKALVKNCKVTGGQNVLMLSGCNNGQFYNNDFSFNSGVGIGMYRCNNNRVLYNKLDFNVRVYGPGVNSRRQNAAGIMVWDQSHQNTFYKNSVTHCGDGFFQNVSDWSTDSVVAKNEGNRILSNDFSYSADCGVESMSSSSYIYDNRLYECEFGIRSVDFYNTIIANNKFRKNRVAIIIENGKHNQIEGNIFQADIEAISLSHFKLADEGRYQGANNVGYTIHLNSFNHNPLVYNFSRTDSVRIYNNHYSSVGEIFKIDSTVTNIDSLPVESVDTAMGFPFVKDPANPFKGSARFAGRDKIMITEWGPYDFRYPFIWNTNPTDTSSLMEFNVLGPKGKWRIISVKGAEMRSAAADTFPAKISFIKKEDASQGQPIEIIAEYKGEAFTDQFGNKVPAQKPYRFVFRKPVPLTD